MDLPIPPSPPVPPLPPAIPTPPATPSISIPRVWASGDPNTPSDAVSVRRPSKWGNPYKIGVDGTREEVVAKHAEWIRHQPELVAALWELAGKHLICCAERPCHAVTLLAMANSVAVPPAPPAPPSTGFQQYFSLASRLRAYDSEGALIIPGLLAPPLVCASEAHVEGSLDNVVGRLLPREVVHDELFSILNSDQTLVGANLPYDLAVAANEWPDLIPFIFKALDEARVFDALLAQPLDAIAGGYLGLDPRTWSPLTNDKGEPTGRYNLWNTTKLVLGRDDAKEDSAWRLSYALLAGTPIKDWPPSAVKYTVDDVKNPLLVAIRQMGLDGVKDPHRNIDCLPDQVAAAFAFQLGAVRGVRTSRERVHALWQKMQAKRDVMTARYQKIGFIRPDGTQDQIAVRRAIAVAYGATGTCPRCEGGVTCPRCAGTKVWREAACKVCDGVGFLVGQIRSSMMVPCRGEKLRGRYTKCEGDGCRYCGGSGEVETLGDPKTCWMTDGGCDGTGLNVKTAPTLHTITTPTGHISISRDTLSESGDEDLHDYGESEHDKVLDTYLPFLRKGVDRPINLSPNPILETLRASYSGVVQTFPSKGGVRECIVARDGCYFVSVDYAALELCSVSQICLWLLGYSRQAEVINETKDPGMLHTSFGARMIGISVEEMKALVKAKDTRAKNARQAAKVGNFTLWGGGGTATTVLANRQKSKGTTTAPDGFEYAGIRFCVLLDGAERCGEIKVTTWGSGQRQREIPPTCLRCLRVVNDVLRPAWYAEWPESKPYFNKITELTGTKDGGRGTLEVLGPRFWKFNRETGFEKQNGSIGVVVTRGGVKFTDGCNGGFQTLAALGAKRAMYNVTRETFCDPNSPMYRSLWPIIFIHDEVVSEVLKEKAAKASQRKAKVMRDTMSIYMPDVFIGAEPALSEILSKEADTVYDENGELTVWRPKAA